MTARLNLAIDQGATFTYVFRWESSEKVYCQVLSATKSAPLEVTVSGETPPVNWRVWVQGASGMKELNREEAYEVTNIAEQTLYFNNINSTQFSEYTGNAVLYYNKPVPLSLVKARMQIRDQKGILILELTTENGGVIIDPVNYTIAIAISAEQTSALSFNIAYYDLEIEDVTLRVQRLAKGTVRVSTEITK